MNQYPQWRYWLILLIMLVGIIYALPNLYGEDPAVQISGANAAAMDAVQPKILQSLQDHHLQFKSYTAHDDEMLIRFFDTDTELLAKEVLIAQLGDEFTVAGNLAPATPKWLQAVGATPMKLGLDLRGGVHFLLEVDVDSVVVKHSQENIRSINQTLREKKLRYLAVNPINTDGIAVRFKDDATRDDAIGVMQNRYPEYRWEKSAGGNLMGHFEPQALRDLRQQTLEQSITILRNRVNQLGISEAVVQQQGGDRVVVDLPGIQDTARAKKILGNTATLEFRMVDDEHDAQMQTTHIAPMGGKIYQFRDGGAILLKDQIILRGDNITSAAPGRDQYGNPSVDITISGAQVNLFSHITALNVHKRMAIIFIETQLKPEIVDGKTVMTSKKTERVISAPEIQQALGSQFMITGLSSEKESRDLALLLRSGALIAPITIIEDRVIGPTMGQENIHKGMVSLLAGLVMIVVSMTIYYHSFGIIANIAIFADLILLTAILSVLGLTLTLPGIAGIVLTLGMGVDANVLINERIREELRGGMSIQASIYAGYERAFTTIVDANVSSLIACIALFSIGTSAVKGFAITTCIGLLTAMLTGVTFTRAMVNLFYGKRQLKKLAIGI